MSLVSLSIHFPIYLNTFIYESYTFQQVCTSVILVTCTDTSKKSQQKCGFNVVFLISHQDKIHFFPNASSIFIILCFSSIDLQIFPARWWVTAVHQRIGIAKMHPISLRGISFRQLSCRCSALSKRQFQLFMPITCDIFGQGAKIFYEQKHYN